MSGRAIWTAVLAAACAACGAGEPALTNQVPAHRPDDGLLADTALQRVVDTQELREAPALIDDLSDDRAPVRARAAFALASVQAEDALPALMNALEDPDAGVRRDAAFALGQLGAPDAVQPLVGAYQAESDRSARGRILEALGKIRAPEALAGLLALTVPDDLEPARTLAVAVLGAVGGVSSPEARTFLLEKLDALDPAIRKAAAYYFGRLRVPEVWSGSAARVRQALDGYDRDDPAAMYLVQGLGRLGDSDDAGRLREWAASARDWRIRVNAVTALGTQSDPETREALLAGLDDPSTHVAIAAAQSLARGEAGDADRARAEAWIDAHPEEWQVVDVLLGWVARSDDAEYVLGWVDAVPAEDTVGQRMALRALSQLPGDEARERLSEARRSSSPELAGEAVEALARRWRDERGDPVLRSFYFDAFSDAVKSGSVRAMYAAAPILADTTMAAMGGVDTLVSAYRGMESPRDLEPMALVLSLLGRSGDPGVEGVLRDALTSGESVLRIAAAAGLSELTGAEVEAPEEAGGGQENAADDAARVDWRYLATLGPAPRLILDTEEGRVVVRMATEEAPLTTQTIARLAQEGRYDDVPFHRVVPNFVVQGGDFASGDGFGGPGFTIRSEFGEIPYLRGVIGMASAGKDTEGSQFFITHSMQPHLDGGYTSFGWVVEGMDVVDLLQVGDRIVKASVEPGT